MDESKHNPGDVPQLGDVHAVAKRYKHGQHGNLDDQHDHDEQVQDI